MNDLNEAIQIDSKNAEAYYLRAMASKGRIRLRRPRRRAGRRSGHADLEVTEWKNPTCLIALAAAFAETGEFAAALEWAEKAVALLPPDHPELKPWKEYIAKYKQKKPIATCRIDTNRIVRSVIASVLFFSLFTELSHKKRRHVAAHACLGSSRAG